ncbi:dihydrofolate reductase family protein [Streptomyces sp. QTS137]
MAPAGWGPSPASGGPPADRINGLPKHVVSGALGESGLIRNNSRLLPAGEAVARIRELRAAEGGDLVTMGRPTLARTLPGEDLVDELRLLVMPVVLGGGRSVFPMDGAKRPFEPASAKTAKSGAQVCVCRRATKAPAGAWGPRTGAPPPARPDRRPRTLARHRSGEERRGGSDRAGPG